MPVYPRLIMKWPNCNLIILCALSYSIGAVQLGVLLLKHGHLPLVTETILIFGGFALWLGLIALAVFYHGWKGLWLLSSLPLMLFPLVLLVISRTIT